MPAYCATAFVLGASIQATASNTSKSESTLTASNLNAGECF